MTGEDMPDVAQQPPGPAGKNAIEATRDGSGVAALVYSTFASMDAAERAGRDLLEARLAGCVNILPAMVSLYVWDGTLERSEEAVLIAKTTLAARDACMARLAERHPYDTPAVLALPVPACASRYLSWLGSGVSAAPREPASRA